MSTASLSLTLSIFTIAFMSLLAAHVSAAGIVVTDVQAPELLPGSDGPLVIELKNTFERDIEDVSFSLALQGLPLSTIGSAEQTAEEIEEDEKEDFVFRLRASPTAKPGDYLIPFTLIHKGADKPKTGTISVRVKGTVEISASVSTQTPVAGRKDKLTVKVMNKGYADARYVSVRLVPSGLLLRSDEQLYIGDVAADDFDTASFDVFYTSEKPAVSVIVEYRDFNNSQQSATFTQPLIVYTEKEAAAKGIIERSLLAWYVAAAVLLVVLWMLWRAFRRRQRMRRSLQRAAGR